MKEEEFHFEEVDQNLVEKQIRNNGEGYEN